MGDMEGCEEGVWADCGERPGPEPCRDLNFHASDLKQVRNWIRKQRFIPCDLSDEFIRRFVSVADGNVGKAVEALDVYFRLRQDPGPIYRDMDPCSPTNRKLFRELYVVPLKNVRDSGCLILLTGSLKQTAYSLLGHFKLLALTIDYLIWDKMNTFTEFDVIVDGKNFQCPALLENSHPELKSIANDFQRSTPIKLRGFYLFRPPNHAKEIARMHDGIWMRVFETPEEVTETFPASILPFEFGGCLGSLEEVIGTWNLQLKRRRKFLIELERRMMSDHRRKMFHECERKNGGRSWVSKMKLYSDITEYKKNYYERMRNAKPFTHPAYGKGRRANRPKSPRLEDPLRKIREMAEDEDGREAETSPEIGKRSGTDTVGGKILVNKGSVTGKEMTEVYGEGGEAAFTDYSERDRIGEATDRTLTEWEEAGETDGRVKETTADEDSEPEIDFREELAEINRWLTREPYLPHDIDEEILITFLSDSQCVEEAEAKIMNYYYARQSMKKVFTDRHPCSPNNLLKYDAVCVVPLTGRNVKNYIIFAAWLAHDDPNKFCPYHQAKLIFTELDILMQENQVRGKTIAVILDMKNYTPEHTDKITKYASKRICYLFTDCFPARFSGFYLINSPDYISDYTNLFGPFDFHVIEYLDDLPGFIPKEYLTSDLAGEPDAPTRDDLFDPFFKRMRRCGNWLAYEEYQRSKEMMLRMTTTRDEWVFKE